MKSIFIWSSIMVMICALHSCGKKGAAVAPGSGSTIQKVSADCNGQSCI